MRLQALETRAPSDFAGAFSAMTREQAGEVIIITSSMFYAERTRIAELAAQSRVPAIYGVREAAAARLPVMYELRAYVGAGGLISYGADVDALWRRAATYVDKILKGARAADLPVEQPAKFELATKTAKGLGLTIPPPLLLRADQVTE